MPQETRHGNVIVLIVGVETPFVLRPCAGGHVLVGEAYAEGCMTGKQAGGKKENFSIM